MKKLIIYLTCIFIMNPLLVVAKTIDVNNNTNSIADMTTSQINDYVLSLLTKGSNIFNDPNIPKDERIIKISELIDKYLDMKWMARFTLGNYRNTLTSEQINQFIIIYSKYLTSAYTNLAKNYGKAICKIKNVEVLSHGQFKVFVSVSLDEQESNLDAQYLLHLDKVTGELKIFDIITENLSLINAQRQEFDSILANNSFEEFIKKIKYKIVD